MKKSLPKRRFLAAILTAALLVGCGQSGPQEPDTRMMNFPGLEWGMTPDEVQAALPLTDPEEREEPDLAHIAVGGGLDVFGAEDAYAVFHFFDYNEDGQYSLSNVKVWFFAGTDHDAVRDALTERYGEPEAPELTESGKWNSETLCQDIMSEEEIAFVKSQNDYAQSLLTKPVTTVSWSTSVYPAYTFPDGREAESQLGFSSDAALYTQEGGLTRQMEAAAP